MNRPDVVSCDSEDSRVVRRAAKYSVEVSSPPSPPLLDLMTCVMAARIASISRCWALLALNLWVNLLKLTLVQALNWKKISRSCLCSRYQCFLRHFFLQIPRVAQFKIMSYWVKISAELQQIY